MFLPFLGQTARRPRPQRRRILQPRDSLLPRRQNQRAAPCPLFPGLQRPTPPRLPTFPLSPSRAQPAAGARTPPGAEERAAEAPCLLLPSWKLRLFRRRRLPIRQTSDPRRRLRRRSSFWRCMRSGTPAATATPPTTTPPITTPSTTRTPPPPPQARRRRRPWRSAGDSLLFCEKQKFSSFFLPLAGDPRTQRRTPATRRAAFRSAFDAQRTCVHCCYVTEE